MKSLARTSALPRRTPPTMTAPSRPVNSKPRAASGYAALASKGPTPKAGASCRGPTTSEMQRAMSTNLKKERVIMGVVRTARGCVSPWPSQTAHYAVTDSMIASSRPSSPDMKFSELRKGSSGRKFGYSSAPKSHRRGSGFSVKSGHSHRVDEGDSSRTKPPKPPSSNSTAYKLDLDYTCKKAKSASSGRKSHNLKTH